MRISSSQIFQLGLTGIANNQAKLNRTQQEISSGQRLLNASDDPVGAVRAVGIDTAIAKAEQYVENGNYARTRLSNQESTVSSVINAMQRVNELTIQANNASQSNETRAAIAREVREQFDNILQLANTRASDGAYLFSGYQEQSQPFSFSNGTLQYHGDDGRRELQLGPSRSVADADPGSRVFTGIRTGNGHFTTSGAATNTGSVVIDSGSVTDYGVWDQRNYTLRFSAADSWEVLDDTATVIATGSYDEQTDISFAGVTIAVSGPAAAGDEFTIAPSARDDIFSIVDRLAQALETPANSGAARASTNNALNQEMSNIAQALDHLVEIQTSIGTRLNVIDQEEDINQNVKLQLQESLSGIRDVDVVEAATRFNQTLVALQASQQAFAKVQQLSLFNYL